MAEQERHIDPYAARVKLLRMVVRWQENRIQDLEDALRVMRRDLGWLP